MINPEIFASVFKHHQINKVMLIEHNDCFNFLISDMSSSITLDRWEHLENILRDLTKKEINIIPYSQAIVFFNKEMLAKGVEVLWKTDMFF